MRKPLENFCYSILETINKGKLAKIDPFNQPAVEQVKVLTKKLLIKSSKIIFDRPYIREIFIFTHLVKLSSVLLSL